MRKVKVTEPAATVGPVAAGPEPGLFDRPHLAATVSFTAVMFLTGFAALAVLPTLPVAARELHALPLYPLAAGCFIAASLLGGVVGGSWADRAGARRPLAVGVVLSVVTLLVSATSTTIWQLAAGRFLDGIAAGLVAVSINTAIGQSYPDRLRARALALMSSSWIIPSLVGPPLAGLVASWWSWRAVFFGLAALTVLPSLAVVAVLRRGSGGGSPEQAAGERPGLGAAAAVSLGAALGQYAVSGSGTAQLACGAAGLALLAVFARRLLPLGTWRAAHGLPASVLLRGLCSGVYFTVEAFVPLLLDTVRRVPAIVPGLAFTGAAVAWAGASWVQSHWLEGVARHRLVAAGALVLAGAAALGALATVRAVPAPVAGAAMVLAAIGMGVLAPSLTLLSLGHAPTDRQGYASSAMQTTQNLGQIGVLGLASALFDALGGPAHGVGPFRVVFAVLVLPCLLVVALAARARARP
ncbi:MFS transporter [Kitasatospora viridis]|uniref:MFS transporter n=1 Tax=Kitasatospora viridis TaxID=281105 RepID=A0A561T7F0_9ACTN|nr:MFS transporter [Kitasatospora viridis]TWF83030.1 MFS transporter [Kitasatospora viridis]